MKRGKETLEEFNHNLNVLPNGLLRNIEDQDIINAKILFYGNLYEKEVPKNWLSNILK